MLKREIERLIAGETIIKEVHLDLTYRNMFQSIDNLWSLLFITGYLTQRGTAEDNCFHMAIPNMEIRRIFVKQTMELFKEKVKKDGTSLEGLCRALQDGNLDKACGGALEQIETRHYSEAICSEEIDKIFNEPALYPKVLSRVFHISKKHLRF